MEGLLLESPTTDILTTFRISSIVFSCYLNNIVRNMVLTSEGNGVYIFHIRMLLLHHLSKNLYNISVRYYAHQLILPFANHPFCLIEKKYVLILRIKSNDSILVLMILPPYIIIFQRFLRNRIKVLYYLLCLSRICYLLYLLAMRITNRRQMYSVYLIV